MNLEVECGPRCEDTKLATDTPVVVRTKFSANMMKKLNVIASLLSPTKTGSGSKRSRRKRTSPYQKRSPSMTEPTKVRCPVCFSDIFPTCEVTKRATKCCGYVFCEPCLSKCAERYNACPMCNKRLGSNGMLTLRFFNE